MDTSHRRNIIVAMDTGALADDFFRKVFESPIDTRATFHVLAVLKPHFLESDEDGQKRMDEAAAHFQPLIKQVGTRLPTQSFYLHLRLGDAFDEVVHLATECGAEGIIMDGRRRGSWTRVVSHVIEAELCTVTLVREAHYADETSGFIPYISTCGDCESVRAGDSDEWFCSVHSGASLRMSKRISAGAKS